MFTITDFKIIKYLTWMKINKEPYINSWYVVAIGGEK